MWSIRTYFVCVLWIQLVYQASGQPPLGYAELDHANVETINREARKALLDEILVELNNTRTNMDALQPDIDACQVLVKDSMSGCTSCVDQACQKRKDDCRKQGFGFGSSSTIVVPAGSSVMSSTINGQSKVTICSLVNHNQICNTVMNPRGTFVNSITQIGNQMLIHLGNAYGDVGNGGVVSFVNGLNVIVNDTNGTMSKELEREMSNMMTNLKHGLSNMQTGIQHSMSQFNHGMNNMMTNLHHGLNQMNSQLAQIGPSITHGLGNLFSNLFGRKKRAPSEPSCWELAFDLSKCSFYKSNCPACTPMQGKDIVKQVCGAKLSGEIKQLNMALQRTTELEHEVLMASNVFSSIYYDPGSLDSTKLSYHRLYVTASVMGSPMAYTSNVDLKLLDPSGTARALAKELLLKWKSKSV